MPPNEEAKPRAERLDRRNLPTGEDTSVFWHVTGMRMFHRREVNGRLGSAPGGIEAGLLDPASFFAVHIFDVGFVGLS